VAPADSVAFTAVWGDFTDPRGDLGPPLAAVAAFHEPELAAADLGDGRAPENRVGFGLIGSTATAPGPKR